MDTILPWSLRKVLTDSDAGLTLLNLAATVLVVPGVVLDVGSLIAFLRHRTTVNPYTPEKSSHLVTGGAYRFSRNPMYLGMLLVLTGVVVWIGNPLGLVLPPPFIMLLTVIQIVPEEKVLAVRFGQRYQDYKKSVRRWL